jgi:predicted ArsR family transcriptional regulator
MTRYERCFQLLYQGQWTILEICAQLGANDRTVRTWIYRLREGGSVVQSAPVMAHRRRLQRGRPERQYWIANATEAPRP